MMLTAVIIYAEEPSHQNINIFFDEEAILSFASANERIYALVFVESFEKERMEGETALLYQNIDEPIENKLYQPELARLQRQLKELPKLLAANEEDKKQPIKD